MVYKHTSGGGGPPIMTTSPIYDYSTGNGGSAPPTLDRAKFGTNKVNRVLPAPTGEARNLIPSDMPRAGAAPSGAQFPLAAGRHEAFRINDSSPTARLTPQTPRGIPNRDAFQARAGVHESYNRGSKSKGYFHGPGRKRG